MTGVTGAPTTGARAALVALLVSAAVLSACSSGTKSPQPAAASSAGDTTAQTAQPVAQTAPPFEATSAARKALTDGAGAGIAPTGADKAMVAKAVGAVLQPGDFPAGFKAQEEAPAQGLSLEALWNQLTACLGVADPAHVGVATSPTFKQGLATQARSTVDYLSEPAAGALADALSGPKAQDCLTQSFVADLNRSKPEGSTAGQVKVTPRDGPQVGQKVLSWRVEATVHLDELVVPLFQDLFVVFNHGTVARIVFLSPGSEFPQDLERTLIGKVMARA